MRIGYCSPFSPLKTGIAEFSQELVLALAPYMELVLFSPAKIEDKALRDKFECHLLKEMDRDELRESLELIVYHMGNNSGFHGEIVKMLRKYPGVTELHEVGLHHLGVEMTLVAQGKDAYLALAEYCHGARGLAVANDYFNGLIPSPWDYSHALDMCMTRPVIENAKGVIVHSEFAKQMVLGQRPEVPVENILFLPIDIVDDPEDWQRRCRQALKLPEKKLIFGSFGFVNPAKRVPSILDALKKYKEKNGDFLYLVVGEVAKEIKIGELAVERGLKDNVQVTGYVTTEQFKTYIGACDFCLNLRYPTQGESSGPLHYMLGMGKPAIVTDIGSFTDYPDEFALKVSYGENEVTDIYEAICTLAGSKRQRRRRGDAALRFARENCSVEKNTAKYVSFFQQLIGHTWRPDYEDTLVGKLCEMGLTDEGYVRHVKDTLSLLSGTDCG